MFRSVTLRRPTGGLRRFAAASTLILAGLAAHAPAATLSSVVGGSGGTYNLPSGTFTGGHYFSSNAVLDGGNHAVIDLMGGSQNVGVAPGVQLTLRNVTVRNGLGVIALAGSNAVFENVRFENTQNAVYAENNANVTLRNCTVTDSAAGSLSIHGSTVTLENVDIFDGPPVLIGQNSRLTWNGGSIQGGNNNGISVFGSDTVYVKDVTIANLPRGIAAEGFTRVDVLNCTILNCVRGMDFANTPGGIVTVRNSTIDGSGLSLNTVQDGLVFSNMAAGAEPLQVDGLTVRYMRSGLVSADVGEIIITNSTLHNNNRNQVNFTRTGKAYLTNSVLQGNPIRGTINVEDFDTLFTQQSDVTARDTMFLDSPDAGILAYQCTLRVIRCFIAGARTAGVGIDRNRDNGGTIGTTAVIADSTIINSYQHDHQIGHHSNGTVVRSIFGQSDNRQAYPSTPGAPAGDTYRGTGLQSFVSSFSAVSVLIDRPADYGMQIVSPDGSTMNQGTSAARFITIRGRKTGTLTREGAYYERAGMQNIFMDNHIFDMPSGQRRSLLLTNTSRLSTMTNNWLGNPGDIGMVHNASGNTNAAHNYWGAANGPSGNFGGSGSQVTGTSGTYSVSPYLTAPPLQSAITTMSVNAAGAGGRVVTTDRVWAALTYQGRPAVRPSTGAAGAYEATLGLTDYRNSETILGLPPVSGGAVRRFFNLWVDARLPILMTGPGDSLIMDLSFPDMGGSISGGTLYWQGENSVQSVSSTHVVGSNPPVLRFTFTNKNNFPTSTMALDLQPGTPSQGAVMWMMR